MYVPWKKQEILNSHEKKFYTLIRPHYSQIKDPDPQFFTESGSTTPDAAQQSFDKSKY